MTRRSEQSELRRPARVLFHRTNYTTGVITFNGVTQTLGGAPRAHVWTSWQTSGTNTWPLAYAGAVADYGFDTEAYEFRFKQTGVTWFWTPLRFPGQYYDDETELHENWNRNYDPSIGQYLQPEPLWMSSEFARRKALFGGTARPYSYARNSPLSRIDPNGLEDYQSSREAMDDLCNATVGMLEFTTTENRISPDGGNQRTVTSGGGNCGGGKDGGPGAASTGKPLDIPWKVFTHYMAVSFSCGGRPYRVVQK